MSKETTLPTIEESVQILVKAGQLYQVCSNIRDLAKEGSDLASCVLEQKDVDDIDCIAGVANSIIKRIMDRTDSLTKDMDDG